MSNLLKQPKPVKARKGSFRVRGGDVTTNPGGIGAGSSGGGGGGESLETVFAKDLMSEAIDGRKKFGKGTKGC